MVWTADSIPGNPETTASIDGLAGSCNASFDNRHRIPVIVSMTKSSATVDGSGMACAWVEITTTSPSCRHPAGGPLLHGPVGSKIDGLTTPVRSVRAGGGIGAHTERLFKRNVEPGIVPASVTPVGWGLLPLISKELPKSESASGPSVKYDGPNVEVEPSLKFTVRLVIVNGTELATGHVGSGYGLERRLEVSSTICGGAYGRFPAPGQRVSNTYGAP
jgi:hypothetical protein